MIALFSVLIAFLTPQANAVISGELNCTTYNGTAFVYTPSATACSNAISDSSCAALYPASDPATGYPAPGNDVERPFACYTTATPTPAPVVPDMRSAALKNCARTCGLCCKTADFDCPNVQFPRLTCSTITNEQCRSSVWRTIIATDCPSACGFCNQGGCVDGVMDCANDLSICNSVGMQEFVNQYCQRTCNRCSSSTAATGTGGSCGGRYIADSSTACAAWKLNGFCTNTFYTAAQRRSYCATTCSLC
ncbi:ShKT domain-containing protein [Caenorhabditis elegans]|uniref:ShKT domain-containing protein n=1 Tax=Caenorhabditis elegans TaxID=6239 RepID=O16225_CAEEL|nr:ShKT domain-containing protein [Caenorhabditis elegans]CCD67688.1 ShKT domain-containing protein [Caenorhabditis elegans]|eukprot:NP_504129.1 PHAryngeal gland Toxin-related [Caenorhabditis elegans]